MSIFGKLKQSQNNQSSNSDKVRNSSLPQPNQQHQQHQQQPSQQQKFKKQSQLGSLHSNYANFNPAQAQQPSNPSNRIPVRNTSSNHQHQLSNTNNFNGSNNLNNAPQSRIPSRSLTPKSHNPDRYPWITVNLKVVGQAPSLIYPPPFPRYGHSANTIANTNGQIFIFGGLVADSAMNDLWLLETDGAHFPNANSIRAHWVQANGDLPPPRVGHRSVLWKNWILIWGGDTLNSDPIGVPSPSQDNSLYAFDINTSLWMKVHITGGSPIGRYGHSMGLIGDYIYIYGGQVNGDFFSDIATFDLNQLQKPGPCTWDFIEPSTDAPPKRTGHVSVTYQDKIYIFGGTDGQYHYNDVWMFDSRSRGWTELSCIGYHPVPREGHSATIVKDVMYIFGGRGTDGKDLGDLAGFNIPKRRWFAFQSMGPAPSGRSGQTMSTAGESVFVFGGEAFSNDGNSSNDDPNIIHVLRHPRINYPKSDDNASAVSRTPTPRLTFNDQQQQQQRQIFHKQQNSMHSQNSQNSESQYVNLPNNINNMEKITSPISASPTSLSSTKQNAIPSIADVASNFNPQQPQQMVMNGQPNAPQRPRRADDAEFGVGLEGQQQPLSPTLNDSPRRPGNLREIRNQLSLEKLRDSPQQRMNDNKISVAARRSVSPQLSFEKAPKDAFYYSDRNSNNNSNDQSKLLEAKENELKEYKKREQWMKVALEVATKNGYIFSQNENDNDNENENNDTSKEIKLNEIGNKDNSNEKRMIIESLMRMKQELTKAHTTISIQSSQLKGKKEESERAHHVILQEATIMKAKLNALENGNYDEVNKINRDKMTSMEEKLTESVTTQNELERKLIELERELESKKSSHNLHNDNLTNVINRANVAEESHLKVLKDLHECQSKLHKAENEIREHGVNHSSSVAKASQFEEAQRSRDEHRNHLTVLRAAIDSSNLRSNELQSRNENLTNELNEKDDIIRQLKSQIDNLKHEVEGTKSTHERAQQDMKLLKDESDKYRELVNNGLSRFLGNINHKNNDISRSAENDTNDDDGNDIVGKENDNRQSAMFIPHDKYLAMEQESTVLRQLLEAAGAKVDETHSILADQNKKVHDLQAKLRELNSEIIALRSQLYERMNENDDHLRSRKGTESELENKEHLLTELQVELNVLKSFIKDDNDKVTNDKRESDNVKLNLDKQLALNEELENKHKEAQSAKQELENKMEEMNALIHDLKLAKDRSVSEDDHNEAKSRIETLEKDYKQAVDYVKGTEKFVYRLKQELIKARENNQHLERDLKSIRKSSRSSVENKESIDKLTKEIETIKQDKSLLEEELTRLKDVSSSKIKELNEVIKEREGRIQAHEREIKRVSNTAAKAGNHSKLIKENEELISKNEALSQRVTTLLDAIPESTSSDNNMRPLSFLSSDSEGYTGAFADEYNSPNYRHSDFNTTNGHLTRNHSNGSKYSHSHKASY